MAMIGGELHEERDLGAGVALPERMGGVDLTPRLGDGRSEQRGAHGRVVCRFL
jgi:hypothetical protein